MNQNIKLLPESELKKITTKIRIPIISDNYTNKILTGYNTGVLSKDEKNQLLIKIISDQVSSGRQYLEGFNFKNSCSYCHGKGFNIFLQLQSTTECSGTHDCLPCGGSGIMTKTCLRCKGETLNDILKKRDIILKYKNSPIPGMTQESEKEFRQNYGHYQTINIQRITSTFIKENGEKTFRVLGAQPDGKDKYYYIQKNYCKACEGTGRFVYKNSERSISCPGCHGKGHIKKHLKTTNNIQSIVICNHCNGSGKTFNDNPVINLQILSPEVRKTLEERNLLS